MFLTLSVILTEALLLIKAFTSVGKAVTIIILVIAIVLAVLSWAGARGVVWPQRQAAPPA